MNRKLVLALALTLLIGMLNVAFNVQKAKASGTIYIRADGSVDPPTAPILREGDFYTLTGNVTSDAAGIVIQRGNMILDGAGYTLQGTGGGTGIFLSEEGHVTIKNTNIKSFDYGIKLYTSFSNSIVGNNITNNGWDGIHLWDSSDYNIISGNNITINGNGISLDSSSDNSVSGNNITNNGNGIYLRESSNNKFYHNNFIDNIQQVYFYVSGFANVWDDGYPSGGNYWSDYEETYPDAAEIDDSGFWDTPYVINENNQDNYPIIPEFPSFLLVPLFMSATLLAAILYRRKRKTD